MSRYRKIDVRIWNDAKFRSLSDDGKMVFLYLLTHPNMTALGAMRASVEGLAHELKWLPERFRKGFGEPLSKGMVEVDEEADLIALPNFLRYNAADNPNVVKAWASCLDALPECALKDCVISRAWNSLDGRRASLRDAFKQAFNGIPNGSGNCSAKGISNGMPNQEQEQEQKQEQEQEQEPLRGAPEEEGYTLTRAREPDEDPYDPPESAEEGKKWLKARGVPPEQIDRLAHKLMHYRLYPSDLPNPQRAAA